MSDRNRVRVHVGFPAAVRIRIRRIAADTGQSESEVVRLATQYALADDKFQAFIGERRREPRNG
jgi:hypothetical protein